MSSISEANERSRGVECVAQRASSSQFRVEFSSALLSRPFSFGSRNRALQRSAAEADLWGNLARSVLRARGIFCRRSSPRSSRELLPALELSHFTTILLNGFDRLSSDYASLQKIERWKINRDSNDELSACFHKYSLARIFKKVI